MRNAGRRPGQVSLERALSKLGIASRGQARELILAGRLKVNGTIRKDPGFPVNPDTARFEVDHDPLAARTFRAIVLHKPRGVMTTSSDEKGRKTVFDLLKPELLGNGPGSVNLHAVGRLDWATSGLLILMNDSRLSSWLTLPESKIPRRYLVSVRGEVTEAKLERIKNGIVDRGETLCPDQVVLRKSSGRESHLSVELTEGKNREIRRLFAGFGHEVTKLKRISYGPLELGELAAGDSRDLPAAEMIRLFSSYGGFPGVARAGADSFSR